MIMNGKPALQRFVMILQLGSLSFGSFSFHGCLAWVHFVPEDPQAVRSFDGDDGGDDDDVDVDDDDDNVVPEDPSHRCYFAPDAMWDCLDLFTFCLSLSE